MENLLEEGEGFKVLVNLFLLVNIF